MNLFVIGGLVVVCGLYAIYLLLTPHCGLFGFAIYFCSCGLCGCAIGSYLTSDCSLCFVKESMSDLGNLLFFQALAEIMAVCLHLFDVLDFSGVMDNI